MRRPRSGADVKPEIRAGRKVYTTGNMPESIQHKWQNLYSSKILPLYCVRCNRFRPDFPGLTSTLAKETRPAAKGRGCGKAVCFLRKMQRNWRKLFGCGCKSGSGSPSFSGRMRLISHITASLPGKRRLPCRFRNRFGRSVENPQDTEVS